MSRGGTLLNPVPAELQAKIRAELNEEESSRERDIGHIRAWLAQQPHLPRIDDDFILAFLRGCKFSLEKTKRKLDMYFTYRGAIPEFFSGRDVTRPEMIANLKHHPLRLSAAKRAGLIRSLSHSAVTLLPDVTLEGCRVLFHYTLMDNGFVYTLLDMIRTITSIIEIWMCEEREPITGFVVIFDGSSLSPGMVAQYTPVRLKQMAAFLQKSMPFRLRQVHVINENPLLDILFTFVKGFLPEKILQKFYIHPAKSDGLYDHVPRMLLPQELGGSAGPVQALQDAWLEKLRQYGDWFRQQEQMKADESLRPGKPRNYGEMFGVEGSFRKLDVD